MKHVLLFVLSSMASLALFSQQHLVEELQHLDLSALERGKIHHIWIGLGEDHLSKPIKIPVLVARGSQDGPVLGITAAIHGNELNGIGVIHELFSRIQPLQIKGTIIAIPGLNPIGIGRNQREYEDGVDLNRIFPGKAHGNRSEQMAYQIGLKLIPIFDYHVDLHTASFGRTNSLYGRGDMQNDTLANMLKAIAPDIIVSNKGKASFGSAAGLTMRAFAMQKGVPSITVEYGNPQVYQKDMIARGVQGLENLIVHLGIAPGRAVLKNNSVLCSKSYWLYTDNGGFLDVVVALNQKLKKEDLIAVLRDSFGGVLMRYTAPEAGIVVGKNTNPVASSGARIIHLGVLQ